MSIKIMYLYSEMGSARVAGSLNLNEITNITKTFSLLYSIKSAVFCIDSSERTVQIISRAISKDGGGWNPADSPRDCALAHVSL